MPRARRGLGGSPVRQGPADTVTELAPLLTMRFARQNPALSSFELVSPRLLDGCSAVHGRALEAGQELGDQVGTLLLERVRASRSSDCDRPYGERTPQPRPVGG